jgi:hypothetical protein
MDTPTEPAAALEVLLEEQNASGKSGTANLMEVAEGLQVVASVEPSAELVEAPAGIYMGTCETLGEQAYALSTVVNGLSETTLDGVALDQVADDAHAVAVFASVDTPDELIACGDIPAP